MKSVELDDGGSTSVAAKKKSKKGKKSGRFYLEDEDLDGVVPDVAGVEQNNVKGSSKFSEVSNAKIADLEDEADVVDFSGMKKKKKKTDKEKPRGFSALADEEDFGEEVSGNTKESEDKNEEDDIDSIDSSTFKGKKKKGKGFASLVREQSIDDSFVEMGEIDGESTVDFSGMKKKKNNKSKKNASKGFGNLVDQDVETALDDVDEPDGVHQTQEQNLHTFTGEIVNDADEIDSLNFSGSKKKKKKNERSKGFASLADQDIDAILDDLNGTNGVQQTQVQNLHLPEGEIGNEADEMDSINFSGLKKKKKKKETSKGFANLMDYDIDTNLDELDGPTVVQEFEHPVSNVVGFEGPNEADTIDFTGLKKKKKKKEVVAFKGFSSLEDQENDEASSEPVKQVENQVSNAIVHEELEIIDFSGSKKKKKKEKSKDIGKSIDQDEIDAILAELDGPNLVVQEDLQASSKLNQDSRVPSSEAVNATERADTMQSAASKKKKKKEKGKNKQADDDDIDAILAELDVGKPEEIQPPLLQQDLEINVPSQSSTEVLEENAVEEAGESAAAKKKKKKREREKAAKIAGKIGEQADIEVPEVKQEPSSNKVIDKKVPKHVREMQERLAKQKEAEERLKREEEEKRRKEEEELKRLEELEKQKEEEKRRKKEREKEKLLKKKQEGKLLTGKQKEEARRLALMREQLLAQKGTGEVGAMPKDESAPKKPKYDNRKKKRLPGVESVSTELPMPDQEDPSQKSHIEVEPVEKEPEEPEVVSVVEDVVVEEDEEEWDAKSWDDENIELPPVKSAFAEDEDLVSSKNKAKLVSTQSSQESKRDALPQKLTGQQPSQDIDAPKRPSSPTKGLPMLGPASAQTLSNGEGNEEESESEEETESEEEDADTKRRKEAALKKEARRAEALANRNSEDLRSPICCILGHVDTGKTKLLDCIRRTNVQEGEAGGITQQIGATYFPMENIKERTKELKSDAEVKLPGLLVIDTPGHESFTNLRSRGSGLCDIAILVIDIMHGLEPQTLESLNLLKMRHTPFVVALNKVDRLYNWKSVPNSPIVKSLGRQSRDVINEFDRRTSQIMTELQEQGLNSELYYKNKEKRKVVSIVPTSAISGEGVPDLLMLLVHLTQKVMKDKLMYISEVECTVLEVKVIEGLGTTIDVILVNGVLHEGDQIVVCGMQGPIVTSIRALLTPHPMKELRVKGSYQHHKELKAAQGIKITAQGLEHAIAGTLLHVVGPDDDVEIVKEEAMQDMKTVMSRVDKSGEGVCVQASTLGSLEALLEFLKSPAVNIPVSGINIGPVHKRDVTKASVMLERKKKEYATILAFDVKVTPEARELAEELGVRIFTADIIYHLFDQFTAYMKGVREEKRKEVADEAVFPCVLSIKPQFVFNKKDPIVLGVDVLEGVARIGTPLCVPSQDMIAIGRIASMEVNHKVVEAAKKGQAVAMKIVGTTPEETQKMYGRHFSFEDELVSQITRRSIDVLKENFRDELSVEEWKLVVKLKKLFNIQ